MFSRKCSKYICCQRDLTLSVRLIGFIGLLTSIILLTILLNDKYANNYSLSRLFAHAFGLDWEHYHFHTDGEKQKLDPQGKIISLTVVFYSSILLIVNTLLVLASIKGQWRLAMPWVCFEILGSISKLGALIFHCLDDKFDVSVSLSFVVGSSIYLAIMIWWLTVVLLAQYQWSHRKFSDEHRSSSIHMSSPSSTSTAFNGIQLRLNGGSRGKTNSTSTPTSTPTLLKPALPSIVNCYVTLASPVATPAPYSPNKHYAII